MFFPYVICYLNAQYNPSHVPQQPTNTLNLNILSPLLTNIYTGQQRNPAAPVLPRGAPRQALEADPVAPGSAMFRKAR